MGIKKLNFLVLFLIGFEVTSASSSKTLPHDVIHFDVPYGELSAPVVDSSPVVRLVDPVQRIGCSAFIVDDNYAITAAHCLNSSGSLPTYDIKLFLNNTNTYVAAKAAGYDTNTDMGLLTGDFHELSKTKVNLTSDGFAGNGPYIACGYPRGQKVLACTQLVVDGTSLDYIMAQSHFHHGMSGGAVIDTSNHTAVGIISAMDDAGEAYVVPLIGFLGVFRGLD